MKINLTALSKIKFKKCQITPVNGRRDDGRRFYITGRLPNYLRRPEILDGDAVTVLRDRSGKLLFRLLIPCPAGCNSLGEPLFLGCNLLHVAAQHPDWTFAEFAADGTPVELAEKLFSSRDDSTAITQYSDESVLLQIAGFAEPFNFPQQFIAQYFTKIMEAAPETAFYEFKVYCANRPEWIFEALLPKTDGK